MTVLPCSDFLSKRPTKGLRNATKIRKINVPVVYSTFTSFLVHILQRCRWQLSVKVNSAQRWQHRTTS